MRYLIAADTRGEMVLCSGDAGKMTALAHRIRQERLFQYVRVADQLPARPAPPPSPRPFLSLLSLDGPVVGGLRPAPVR